MTNLTNSILTSLSQPSFRIYFALQHVVLLEKSRLAQNQIFSRLDIPRELRLSGKFSLFCNLLSTLIRQSLASYPVATTSKLVFVTADYDRRLLTLRITDGGSGLRYQNRHLLRESSLYSPSAFKTLNQLETLISQNFFGQLEIHNFSHRGTQVTIKLPVPTDTQNPDKF